MVMVRMSVSPDWPTTMVGDTWVMTSSGVKALNGGVVAVVVPPSKVRVASATSRAPALRQSYSAQPAAVSKVSGSDWPAGRSGKANTGMAALPMSASVAPLRLPAT